MDHIAQLWYKVRMRAGGSWTLEGLSFLPFLPLYNWGEFLLLGIFSVKAVSKVGERLVLLIRKVDIGVKSSGGLGEWVEQKGWQQCS